MTDCKECKGTGRVVFTRERGGPTCNNCGGGGIIDDAVLRPRIAIILDAPSVYMGGPSHSSLRKADVIIKMLKDEGVLQ